MEAMQLAWDFFQNQILGMKWLNTLTGRLLCALGVDITGRWGGALQFFIYDTIKIFVLLSVLIFGISYIQSFFPPERTKKILGRFHGLGANTLAALLGTVTPFCSCSSIPLFMGFTSAGIPLGVSFSFLISSPLVDLGSLVLLTSVFGGSIAVTYVAVGLVLAVIGGSIIERLGMEEQIEDFIREAARQVGSVDLQSPTLSTAERLDYAKNQVLSTVRKVAPYVLVGVGIGAASTTLSRRRLWSGCWAADSGTRCRWRRWWARRCTPTSLAPSRLRKACTPRVRGWGRCSPS